MANGKPRLLAIGGGELAEANEALDEIVRYLNRRSDNARLVVMTVATNHGEEAAKKYKTLFSEKGIKRVEAVDVSQRHDAFADEALKMVERADALFFTGGDQLNITSLLGGSPLHNLVHEKYEEGVLIAGSSAGAAMMSSSMIISGESDMPPRVGGLEIAPGMNMIEGTVVDSHFSQRGRYGRLLTAVAHYPQLLGVGIDERTAALFQNGDFKVIGEGVVTVIDASCMKYCDLPYRKSEETIGMFGVTVHVLPRGYSFQMKERRALAPKLTKMAGAEDAI